jgi:beta-glucosidase
MVNIARVPQGGRNFESFGEDPTLSSKLVVSYVKGVQDHGLIAVVKHWSVNNQEENRALVNVNVDERTQWELYYPAFQAAVDAGVGSGTCFYHNFLRYQSCVRITRSITRMPVKMTNRSTEI